MKTPTSQSNKIAASILIFGCIVSGTILAQPRPAHAQWAVFDAAAVAKAAIGNAIQAASKYFASQGFVKEYILDPAAWVLAKHTLASMTNSLVSNISTAFPAPGGGHESLAVTNLAQHLQNDVSVPAATAFVKSIKTQGAAKNSPFTTQVSHNVAQNYVASNAGYTNNCSLDSVTNNHTSQFLNGDFAYGGWGAWNSLVLNPDNNPYDTQSNAQQQLQAQIATKEKNRTAELTMNGSFLSTPGNPGGVIKAQLEKALGSNIGSLTVADELDETLVSAATNLFNQAFSGSGGILGLSQAPSSGGLSYLQQYANAQPPQTVVSNTMNTLISQINNDISEINTYKSNLQKILAAGNNAKSNLNSLISAATSYGGSGFGGFGGSSCSTLISAANTALSNKAQPTVTQYSNYVTSANSAISALNADLSLATYSKNNPTQTNVQNANNAFTRDTSGSTSVMPSYNLIENAQLQSESGGANGNPATSSGTGGLNVYGGTLYDQMNILAGNANYDQSHLSNYCP